jgi:hypothetical protein
MLPNVPVHSFRVSRTGPVPENAALSIVASNSVPLFFSSVPFSTTVLHLTSDFPLASVTWNSPTFVPLTWLRR